MAILNTGDRFTIKGTEYVIDRADDMVTYPAIAKAMIESDKEPVLYSASKVLKSGKISPCQGGLFYRFNSGNMIKSL